RFAEVDGELRAEFERTVAGQLPEGLAGAVASHISALIDEPKKIATRKASQMALEVINPVLPETVGGSADLTGSNNTRTSDMGVVTAADQAGRYIYYGVREFAMGAVMNGLSLHGGFIPYGGTFLVFSDYARPAMRLSALMGQRVIYVMTHDSIGLGEDGPTHQPVEHLASLRAMPGLVVYRPADAVETAECWLAALQDRGRPSVLALSRQGLEQVRLEHADGNLSARGGYVLREADGAAAVTIIATGSEVGLALEIAAGLAQQGIVARTVSMPSVERFEEQDWVYREGVLGTAGLNVTIEAGATQGWHRYAGPDGLVIGIDSFGESAPASDLFKHFGFSAVKIIEEIMAKLAG
ncbi:MAG: transketolase C-terminal domain-containing protein, partial [Sphingomonadales bacterium]